MVLNIYKEKGWTSFDVVAKCRGILKTKKVGHAGTLDPLAEGVLVVLTDEDTKRQTFFMNQQKEYIADITYGINSPTFDLGYDHIKVTPTSGIPAINLQKYKGVISQQVPMYSAIKIQGKRLYSLARANTTPPVDLPVRNITIYEIELLDSFMKEIKINDATYCLPTHSLRVVCSSGTYVRALARDLGLDVGMSAVLTKLVRTRIGDFKINDSIRISELKS